MVETQYWYYNAWNYKGVSLVHLNRFEEAIMCFNQAIEIDPNAEEAWQGKRKCLTLLGKNEEAYKCLETKTKLLESTENNKEEIKRQIANLSSEIKNYIKKRDDKFIEAGETAYSECISANHELPSDVKIKFDDILAFDTLINKTNVDIESEKKREKKTGFLSKLGGAVSSVAKQGKYKIELYNLGKNKKSAINYFGEILWESYKKEGYTINSISNIWQVVQEINRDINIKENEIGHLKNLLKQLNAEELFDLGVNAEDSEKKLEYFSKALEINPKVAIWWVIKGGTLNDLGRYNEAMTCCDKALEIDPESGSAWNYKGVSLKNLESYIDAIACFDKALEIDPDYENAKINREMLNKELRKEITNEKILDDTLEEKTDEEWINNGMSFGIQKRYDEALKCFDMAIQINQMNDSALENKGIALKHLGKYNEAVTCLEKALQINPKNARAWKYMGYTFYDIEKYHDAIKCYNKALELDPENVDVWENKGVALYFVEMYDEAIKYYDMVLKIKPEDNDVWGFKGHALQKLGRIEDANICFEKAPKS